MEEKKNNALEKAENAQVDRQNSNNSQSEKTYQENQERISNERIELARIKAREKQEKARQRATIKRDKQKRKAEIKEMRERNRY